MPIPYLVTLFTFIDGLAQGIYGTIFNLLLRSSGLSTSAVGRITSFSLWGIAFFGLIFGLLADRFDKKQLMVFTHLLSVFFGTYRILVTSVHQFAIMSLLFGGFSSATSVILSTLLILKTDARNRSKHLGMNFGIGMFTGVLGNVFGGVFGDLFGLRPVLIVSSLSRLIAIYPILKMKASELMVKRESNEGILRFFSIVRNMDYRMRKIVVYYFLSTISVGFGAGLFVSFGNVIFYDIFHMKPAIIGSILASAQLATSLGAMFSHKLGKKFGDMNVLIFSYVVVPILIVMLSFVREPITFTSVYILRFAVMNMVSPLLTATVFSSIDVVYLSSINGMNVFFNNVSRAFSAELFAYFTRFNSGYTLIFAVSSVFYFVNAYVMIRMYKHIRES